MRIFISQPIWLKFCYGHSECGSLIRKMINLGHLSIFGGLYSVNSLVEVCQNLTLVTTVFFDQHVFVMFNYAATTAFLGFQAATIIIMSQCVRKAYFMVPHMFWFSTTRSCPMD